MYYVNLEEISTSKMHVLALQPVHLDMQINADRPNFYKGKAPKLSTEAELSACVSAGHDICLRNHSFHSFSLFLPYILLVHVLLYLPSQSNLFRISLRLWREISKLFH